MPNGSYSRLICLDALWQAYLDCRQGKRRQPKMAAFDIDADRHVCALQRQLQHHRYCPDHWQLRVIHDPKTRLIAAPSIRDRIVHRALLNEIGGFYQRRFIDHSFTVGQGRGVHRDCQTWLNSARWLRSADRDRNNPEYRNRNRNNGFRCVRSGPANKID